MFTTCELDAISAIDKCDVKNIWDRTGEDEVPIII